MLRYSPDGFEVEEFHGGKKESIRSSSGLQNQQLYDAHESQPIASSVINVLQESSQSSEYSGSEIEKIENDLKEAHAIILAQQDDLNFIRQEVAIYKTNYDDMKMRNMELSASRLGNSEEMSAFVQEYNNLREEVERLRSKARESDELTKRLSRERDYQKSLAEQRECFAERGTGKESFNSKNYAGQSQGYSSNKAANFMGDDVNNKFNFGLDGALRIGNDGRGLMSSSPNMQDGDVNTSKTASRMYTGSKADSQSPNHFSNKFISRSKNMNNSSLSLESMPSGDLQMVGSGNQSATLDFNCQATAIEKSAVMAQTKRRLRDRIREFFRIKKVKK